MQSSLGPAQESLKSHKSGLPSTRGSEVGLLIIVIVRVDVVSNTNDEVAAASRTLELRLEYKERPSLGYEAVTVSLVFARCTDSCRSHAVTTSVLSVSSKM